MSTTPINPESIHTLSFEKSLKNTSGASGDTQPNVSSSSTKTEVMNAIQAQSVPVFIYYEKMNLARSITSTITPNGTGTVPVPSAIVEYLDAGFALVNAYCLRWFQRMNDQSIYKQFGDESENLIYALGTTLLGLGKANSYFVTSWGASNTFVKGESANYSNNFLLGSSPKIKAQVMKMLVDEGKVIRNDGEAKTFLQAYTRLEQYADLCTSGTVRDILGKSLDSVETKYDNGKIIVNSSGPAISTTIANLSADVRVVNEKLQTANEKIRVEKLNGEAAVSSVQRDAQKEKADIQKELEQEKITSGKYLRCINTLKIAKSAEDATNQSDDKNCPP